jgi:hypothetical protein
MQKISPCLLLLLVHSLAFSQSIGEHLPKKRLAHAQYLFYFHGGVVTLLGDMAINQSAPEWGPYEYKHILDSLQKRGFHVISEIRKKGVDDSIYVNKTVLQVDSLLKDGVNAGRILLLGASSGWNIVLHAAHKLKNNKLKYVLMGGCWPNTFKDYTTRELQGHYLSVIETSDPHGTCESIFRDRNEQSSFKEVKLNTGLSHGFIYKGHRVWINPIVRWFQTTN